MQQQRNDHLGLETVECTFRRSSNMFWGEGVELQSRGEEESSASSGRRMPPNHKIKAASLLVFQELRNATANRKLSFPENSLGTLSCLQYEPAILLSSSSSSS
jgi:hypothetical protein